jgi:hypothetical protein
MSGIYTGWEYSTLKSIINTVTYIYYISANLLVVFLLHYLLADFKRSM